MAEEKEGYCSICGMADGSCVHTTKKTWMCPECLSSFPAGTQVCGTCGASLSEDDDINEIDLGDEDEER